MNLKKNFNYKGIAVIILVLFIGIYFYYKNYSSTKTISVTPVYKKAEKNTVKSSISASGNIATANYLAVTTSVNGIIKDVYVKEGDVVKSGQKLMEVTLDSEGEKSKTSALASYTGTQIQLQEAKNKLITLQSTLKQKQDLFNTIKETTSYQTDDEKLKYQLAEADYLAAKNAYDLQARDIAQAQLSLSSSSINYQSQSPIITAPANGIIANIVAVKGMKVENSVSEKSIQTVASIKQQGSPIATVNITEIDINNVKVGQKVNLSMNSIQGEKFLGQVVGIDRIGASSNGVSNYPVIIKFDKDSEKVLPNMSVDAEIIVDEKENVLAIPSAAIVKEDGKTFVNISKNNELSKTEVKVGLVGNTTVEILEGIAEGDSVLISGFPTTGFTTSKTTTNQIRIPGVSGGDGGRF